MSISYPRRPPGRANAVPYRSIRCRLGAHAECKEAVPRHPLAELPLIYETCACPCHQSRLDTSGKGEIHG